MQRAHFKKHGDYLSFNSLGAEPVFLIVQEVEAGFMYMVETTPFGGLSFVHRHLVIDEDAQAEKIVEEKKSK